MTEASERRYRVKGRSVQSTRRSKLDKSERALEGVIASGTARRST